MTGHYICVCDLLQNLYEEIQTYDGRVTAMLESGQTLIGKCSPSTSASLVRSLDNLATRWQSVKTRADERKLKLEEALRQADSFHESLNSSIVWLTNTEKTLNNVKPVSRVVDSCLAQIEQHKVGMAKVVVDSCLAQIEQHEVGMAKVVVDSCLVQIEQHKVGMAKVVVDSCLAQIEQHKVGMAQIEQHKVGMAQIEQHKVGMAKVVVDSCLAQIEQHKVGMAKVVVDSCLAQIE